MIPFCRTSFFSLILILLSGAFVFGRSNSDSVQYFLRLSSNDSVKIQKLYHYAGRQGEGHLRKIEIYKAALVLAEKNAFYKKASRIYEELGYSHQMLGFSDLAFNSYKKGMELALENKDTTLWKRCCYKIGYLFSNSGQGLKGIEYFKQLLRWSKIPAERAGVELAVGIAYTEMDSIDVGISFLNSSLKFYEGKKEGYQLSYIYNTLAGLYLKRKNYISAENLATKALNVAKRIESKDICGLSSLVLVQIANKKGEYKKALQYFKNIPDTKSPDKYYNLNLAYNGYETYSNLKDYENAVKWLREAYQLKESLYNSDNSKSMNDIEQKYQNKNKQLEIENQKLTIRKKEIEKEQINEQKKRQTIIFFVIIFLMLGNGIFIYSRYLKSKRDSKIILKQKNVIQEKQNEIVDSIEYASRIQKALMTSEKYIEKELNRLKKS